MRLMEMLKDKASALTHPHGRHATGAAPAAEGAPAAPGRAMVEVAAFEADRRYRLVRLGDHTEPLTREEFEPRIRREFPDIDLGDPRQLHWADRPWEWPAWHPGEA